jgi:translation initiation factor eIF-2B subunit delta
MDRRRSDQGTSAQVPVMQVVGFHVEGMSPSPVPNSILGDRKQVAGSPTPVIIPPTFQVCPATV